MSNINAPNSLFLGYDYFGYSSNPGSNFVIGTLAGGKRNFQGMEFVFRKRFSNNWQVLSSYNWSDGKGNSNSDGNADFQGDVIFLDPRAPNQYGTQPGLIRHLLITVPVDHRPQHVVASDQLIPYFLHALAVQLRIIDLQINMARYAAVSERFASAQQISGLHIRERERLEPGFRIRSSNYRRRIGLRLKRKQNILLMLL